MVRKVSFGVVAALLVLANASITEAGTLYGLSSFGTGNLYTIDGTTGAATLVTPISHSTSLVGADFLNGTLYATDVIDGGFRFGSIDIVTGVFTPINDQDGSANWHGLAANEAGGVLYTIDINDGNNLKSVTAAGVVTTIGAAGIDGRGMAYDNTNGILYATGSGGNNLYTVDTTTGAATLVGALGITANTIGLTYDEATGTLFANSGDLGNLYTLDVTTGAATLVGSNLAGGAVIDGLGDLQQTAVPEPASVTLAVFGLVGACGTVWRRRRQAA